MAFTFEPIEDDGSPEMSRLHLDPEAIIPANEDVGCDFFADPIPQATPAPADLSG